MIHGRSRHFAAVVEYCEGSSVGAVALIPLISEVLMVLPRPVFAQFSDSCMITEVSFAVAAATLEDTQYHGSLAAFTHALAEVGLTVTDTASWQITWILDAASGPGGSTHPERYSLETTPQGAVIRAETPHGWWNGAMTFLQLLSATPDHRWTLPCGVIHDEPRYSWRGFTFDIARHFFGLNELCRLVDYLARYKFSSLHLHLTDDQGWRLQIPSRPELTERSAGSDCSGGPGGYLTVAEYRQLQRYAQDRMITVIPEFDVPGHTNAATHADGSLRADGVPTEVYTGIEVGFSTLDIDLPSTEAFLRDVFGDIAAMTDGPYLHYGGDEAKSTDRADYLRFIELIERIVRAHGKIPMAWNEASLGPIGTTTVIQYWDSHYADGAALRDAASRGVPLVMSPGNRTYLDMKYTADFPLGQDWAGVIDLDTAYRWDPAAELDGVDPQAIIGVEAALWTETLPTFHDIQLMLFPRLPAIAEVAWTQPERTDWEQFTAAIAHEAHHFWEPQQIAFYRSPQVAWEGSR